MSQTWEVNIDCYRDQKIASTTVHRALWDDAPDDVLSSHVRRSERPLGGMPTAYRVLGTDLAIYGGEVHGGPEDGAHWRHDKQVWHIPIFPATTLAMTTNVPRLQTASYGWRADGWMWVGYREVPQ